MFGRLVSTKESQKPLAIGISLLLAGGFLAGVAPSSAVETPLNGTAPTIHDPQPSDGPWVSVPMAQRLYAEDLGGNYDDHSFFSIPADVECEGKSGPMILISANKQCEYKDSDTVFRYARERNGAVDIGFEINFFGVTYDSLFPNVNGGVFFASPDTAYDHTVLQLSGDAESSAIYPLGMDLFFNGSESNFWVGNTTLDGFPAFVMSWENVDTCCNDGGPTPSESASFQLVLIDLGAGDFDAYFNYAKFVGMSSDGYSAPRFSVDMSTTTPGDSFVRFDTIEGFPVEGCVEMDWDDENGTLGQLTDEAFEEALDNDFFGQLLDASTKSVALFTDDACSLPIEIQVAQSIDVDRYAYVTVELNDSDFNAPAIGWGTYSADNGRTQATELRKNIDISLLVDGEPGALITAKYRTDVPGRFVIGQRDGGTVGDPATADEETVSTESSYVGKTYGPTEPRPVYTNQGGLTVSNETGSFLEYFSFSTENEHNLYGPDWNFSAYSVVESGNGKLPLATDGSLKLRTKGSVALRGTGYEPKAKVAVYAMPSGTLLGNVRATKAGDLKLSNFKIPKGAPLENTHIQVIGKSSSGEVRFKTFSVVFYDRNKLTGAYSEKLSWSQKANLRKMAYRATGETIATCVTLVPEAGNTDSLGSAAASNSCQYLVSQYPNLTTKVKEITSSKVSKTRVRIVFSR